jgi:ATP-binding cassette subfamily F protein 3
MSLVVASRLSLAYGPKVLLWDAAFSIGPTDRIGLVGANGTGKSTLLKILAGDLHPDSGDITWRRGARAAYLPQDVAELPPGSLVESVLAAVPGRGALEERLHQAEAALASATQEAEQLELSQALADLHEGLDHFEERFGRRRAERLLSGLGFTAADLSRDIRTFSGGWKMRAALAGLLLADPDLLLLDEPTNHLDIPTLEWFDAFLRGTRRAVVLISHDREFLDRQIDRVLSLEPEGLCSWSGDYGDYKRQRAERETQLEAQSRRVEARRAELQGFIDRFGAKATKAAQARSKQKLLDRMEDVVTLEQRATLRFRFAEAPRSGREVVKLRALSKAYGEKRIYRGVDATVLRGERVGVIGPNGAGKTTLLKLAAGETPPDAGTIELGHGVVAGYYAQHHFDPAAAEGVSLARAAGGLDPKKTVLETLWDLVPDRGESYVRSIAGSFLFSGEDADKPVAVLSGGERARVALARLLLVPANLLILDEPTNHLDLDSSEALIEALKGYAGTLLFVSHNRSFLNQLATVIWEVRDGGVLSHPGNLDDWSYHQRQLAAAAEPQGGSPEPGATGSADAARGSDRDRKRSEAEARNTRYRLERPIREEIARLEEEIGLREREEREASAALADPALYQDFARAKPHIDKQRSAREALERLYAAWEAAHGKLGPIADQH